MSLVDFDAIKPRDARSAASLNGFYTAFEGMTRVDPENLAVEGLDAQCIDNYARIDEIFTIEMNGSRTLLAQTATYAQFNPGIGWRCAGGTVGNLATNEKLELRARIHFETTTALAITFPGIQAGATLTFRFAYNTGAADVAVQYSERIKVTRLDTHGSIELLGVLEGPLALSGGYVEVQYKAEPVIGPPVLQVYPSSGTFVIRKFKRTDA